MVTGSFRITSLSALTRPGAIAMLAAAVTGLAAPSSHAQDCGVLGQNIASQDTHPMPQNMEDLWPEMTQEQKEALVANRPHDRGGPTTCSGTALGLFYPFDRNNTAGWTMALGRSDDGSSVLINLGFTFQFYGTNYTSCYINNNGNITFGAPFGTYVPTGFPSATVPPMIAPFWSDIDTRNLATGQVWYKIIDSNNGGLPDTLIVTWDNVSYFNSHSDLQNTFQLVISNFTNPAMQPGSNVCFDYDNMCFTTGDVNGVNGFTDPPSATTGNATVGINRGSAGDYFQVGRFGISGTAYDGPFGAADGVSYLDNRRFCFNTQTGNVPPVAASIPVSNTFSVSAGQVLNTTITFLSPEFGQTTTTSILDQDGAVAAGLVITQTPGNVARVDFDWTTGCTDVGQYTVIVTARDNFVPQGVTTVTLTIRVNEVNSLPTVSITAPAAFSGVCTTEDIIGTATANNASLFGSYTLAYATSPAGPFTTFVTNSNQVSNGVLGTWNTAGLPQGYYFIRLRAANICGPTREFITVLAKCGPPVVAVQPVAETALSGQRICLRVYEGGFCGSGFQWQRNGVNLVNGGGISGATADELIIFPSDVSDSGSYRCVLTNGCGTVNSNAVVVRIFCPADINLSGLVSVQDIFDFLQRYFTACP
jgi:hypothetical protein